MARACGAGQSPRCGRPPGAPNTGAALLRAGAAGSGPPFFGRHGLADDAYACAAALSAISEATAQPEAIATLAHALGETLLPDDPAAAARELRRAAAMLDDLGLPFAAAQAWHPGATAAMASGDTAAAPQLLQTARRAAERLGARQLLCDRAPKIAQLGDNGSDGGGKSGGRGAQARAIAGLTARELDVMRLVADGNTARQRQAQRCSSARGAVEMHVQGCLLKLGCRTRAEAVRPARRTRRAPAPQRHVKTA